MESIIIGALVILLLIVAILVYCGMVVASREDEAMKKLFEEMEEKRKGKK